MKTKHFSCFYYTILFFLYQKILPKFLIIPKFYTLFITKIKKKKANFNKSHYFSNNLIGEEILPSNWSQIIEQSKFAYSPLGKALEKQTEKQFDAIESLDFSNQISELD